MDVFESSQLCPDQDPRPHLLQLMSNRHVEYPTIGELIEALAAEEKYGLREGGAEEKTQTRREGILIHSRTGTSV